MTDYNLYKKNQELIKRINDLCFSNGKSKEEIIQEFKVMVNIPDYEFTIFEFLMRELPEYPRAVFFHHGWGIKSEKNRKATVVKDTIEESRLGFEKAKANYDNIFKELDDFKNWTNKHDELITDKTLFEIENYIKRLSRYSLDTSKKLDIALKQIEGIKFKPFKAKELYILTSKGPILFKKFPNIEIIDAYQKIREFFNCERRYLPVPFTWISLPAAVNHKLGEAIVYIGNNYKVTKELLLNVDGQWQWTDQSHKLPVDLKKARRKKNDV
jgi:hypothetical protein